MAAMTDLPDVSLSSSSTFVQGSGLVVGSIAAGEVTGHIDAGAGHHTPWGVVHGGVYATAIESACSIGASAAVADDGAFAVGLSNHTDFIRAHSEGRLDVRARAGAPGPDGPALGLRHHARGRQARRAGPGPAAERSAPLVGREGAGTAHVVVRRGHPLLCSGI